MSHNETSELAQIKEECRTMTKMLKKLQEQEISLKCQNKILAREAIHLGYNDSFTVASSTTAGGSSATSATTTTSTSGDAKKSSKKRSKIM